MMEGDTLATPLKAQPILRITPDRILEFPFELYNSVAVPLVLENLCESHVAFKIKTTAPKSYLVRPSTGTLSPKETVQIQIVLQSMTADVEPTGDRFLIQATQVSDDKPLPREYWGRLDKAQVQDQRLSVVFIRGPSAVTPAQPVADVVPTAVAAPTPSVDLGGQAVAAASSENTLPSNDLKTKHDQVTQYCMSLENSNSALNKEIEALRAQVAALSKAQESGEGGNNQSHGLEIWHVMALLIVVVVVLKMISYL